VRAALDVHQALLARDVQHEIVRLRTRVASADELPRAMDLNEGCAAVRCYRLGDRAAGPAEVGPPAFVAVLVAAGTTPDARALLRALQAAGLAAAAGEPPELREASPTEVNAVTDFAAGLVSPVGLPTGVPLVVDAALAARHVLYTAAGEGGVALGIRTRDLLETTGAHVAPLDPLPQVVLPDAGGDADADAAPTLIDLDARQAGARRHRQPPG
jgi:hypothetical protein